MWPPPSNSAHQDSYIFSRGFQPKPSFATVIGRGPYPKFNQKMFDFLWTFCALGVDSRYLFLVAGLAKTRSGAMSAPVEAGKERYKKNPFLKRDTWISYNWYFRRH